MPEMFSWYIDNRYYITEEFVNKLLEYSVEAKSNEEPLKNVFARKEPSAGNPSSPVTFARNIGIIDNEENWSDTTKLYQNRTIPFSNFIFDLIAKRNVSKTEQINMKPLVVLCVVFSKMVQLDIDETEQFITTAECYEYLSVLSSYEEITNDLVLNIVNSRTYTGRQHVPQKRVEVRNEVYLSSIFDALCKSGIFYTGIQKSIIHPQKKYSELIEYIAANGTRISIAPIADGGRQNEEFYSYCSNINNGILEIFPELPLLNEEIPATATKDIYNYLFDVETQVSFDWHKYFEQDCRGIYRIFFPLQWLIVTKIYLKNAQMGEYLFDFVNQHPLYIENFKEGQLVIELPFSNSEHTDLNDLTDNSIAIVEDEKDLYQIAAHNVLEYISSTDYQFEITEEEIEGLYKDFANNFSPEQLKQVPDEKLLNHVFYTAENENNSLCYYIELQPQIREAFGSVAGGSSFKFGLFQRKEDGAWITGSANKQTTLTYASALELGKDIVSKLLKGAEIIGNAKLENIADYERLDQELNEAIGKYATYGWVHKYFHMLYPSKIATWHSTDWQNHILYANGIMPNQKYYARSGQLVKIASIAKLTMPVYAHASMEMFGGIKTFYRIGTSNDEGNQFATWINDSVVSIGWNNIGSIEQYERDKEVNRKALTTALETKYYSSDKRTASTKAGEISRFYKSDKDTVFVAMDGETLLAFGDDVGKYYFDEANSMAHCKSVMWHQCFGTDDRLPIKNEGLLTTCYHLKKEENLMYLYRKYYGKNNDEMRECELKPQNKDFKYEEISMVPKQIIYYGAPGTGKSFEVDKQLIEKYPDEEARDFHTARVVFHPDYTYSDFVGSIRPVKPDGKSLTYEFVAGPFSELLKKCFLHSNEEFYLVLEEINRGNAAAIFGDLFQLLDRDDKIGKSSYRINNTDVAGFLKKDKRLSSLFVNDKVWLPSNFNIVCTMNTADQNVFVLDSAFKRRFAEEYTGIDFSKLTKELQEATAVFNGTTDLQQVFANTNLKNFIDKLAESGELKRDWPTFAKIVNYIIDDINEESGSEQISEDKKLGPFFVSVKDLENRKNFINKVLHYLKQDVFKYVDFYFTESYQTIHSKYIKETADIFNLLKRQGE